MQFELSRLTNENIVSNDLTLKVPEKLQLYGLYVYYVVHICDFGMLRFKGSLTHLQALQISMKFLLEVASDIRIMLEKKLELKPFSLKILNKNVTQTFF